MRAAAREGEMIGHGVVTAGTQGLAAKQPPSGQHTATWRPEARDRHPGVIRTAGLETAALAQQRADPALVLA